MQTAVEYFDEQIQERVIAQDVVARKIIIEISMEDYMDIKRQAEEMEKQHIIDAHLIGLIRSLEMEATKQATEYYNETYGSKGSDDTLKENHIVDTNEMVSSQTEISDKEIWNEAKTCALEELITSVDSFVDGAKWYREQLKKKQ